MSLNSLVAPIQRPDTSEFRLSLNHLFTTSLRSGRHRLCLWPHWGHLPPKRYHPHDTHRRPRLSHNVRRMGHRHDSLWYRTSTIPKRRTLGAVWQCELVDVGSARCADSRVLHFGGWLVWEVQEEEGGGYDFDWVRAVSDASYDTCDTLGGISCAPVDLDLYSACCWIRASYRCHTCDVWGDDNLNHPCVWTRLRALPFLCSDMFSDLPRSPFLRWFRVLQPLPLSFSYFVSSRRVARCLDGPYFVLALLLVSGARVCSSSSHPSRLRRVDTSSSCLSFVFNW